MVGRDQQPRRVGETRVGGEPGGIGVSVRTDDRQVLYAREQRPSDRSRAGLRWKQAVGVKPERCHARLPWSTGA